tara:strand:+ start:146 stop:511 length:366 start_codon:yes stop_codon:yes gene_type:complete
MAIIRNVDSKFTAELTEVELLLYLIVHYKLTPEKAEESLIKNAGERNSFYVRLPPEIDSLRKLAHHLKETRELDELSETFLNLVINEIADINEFIVKREDEFIIKKGALTNDRHDISKSIH